MSDSSSSSTAAAPQISVPHDTSDAASGQEQQQQAPTGIEGKYLVGGTPDTEETLDRKMSDRYITTSLRSEALAMRTTQGTHVSRRRSTTFQHTSKVGKLLQCTHKILEWMSRNEEHLRPLVELVVGSVYELMACQRVTLYFVDHVKRELWIALAKDASVRGLRIPLGTGIAGHVAETGQAFVTGDCYAQKFFDKSIDEGTGFHTESMVCVPIFSRQDRQATAVLSAINRRPDGSPVTPPEPVDGTGTVPPHRPNNVTSFDDDDLHVLKTFAMQVGVALRKCTLQLALAKMVADNALQEQKDDALIMAQKSLFAEFHPPSPRHARSGSNVPKSDDVAAIAATLAMGGVPSTETLGEASDNTTATADVVVANADSVDVDTDSTQIVNQQPRQDPEVEKVVYVAAEDLPMIIQLDAGVEVSVQRLRDWQFDGLVYEAPALATMSVRLLLEFLPEDIAVPASVVTNFVTAIGGRYQNLAFHNFNHGFSVMQLCYVILRECPIVFSNLSLHKRFAMLVAALCHDVGHPGVNNNFLVNARDPLALQHNDDAVLERHHCYLTFSTMQEADCNILRNAERTVYQKIRATIIEAILGTEMSRHSGIMDRLHGLANPAEDFRESSNQGLLIQSIVHAADLSAQAMKPPLSDKWGDRVLMEFARQSDLEHEKKLPITPFMVGLHDLKGPVAMNMQKGFVQHFICPLWQTMGRIVPELQPFAENAVRNAQRYSDKAEEAKKAATATQ